MPSDFPSDAPKPRLCHLVKWADFDGYGFNLHADKVKEGQFIGKVDDNSPAELAGLKEGDRIIEVNGVNIANENHKQVVERIKAIANETKLLVLDAEAEQYYKHKKVVVKGTQSNVHYQKTPAQRPASSNVNSADDNDSLDGRKSSPSPSPQHQHNGKLNGSFDSNDEGKRSRSSSTVSDTHNDGDKVSRNSSSLSTPPADRKDGAGDSPMTLTPPRTPSSTGTPTNGVGDGKTKELNLNMTASEMRAMLAQKKKFDPKKEHLDFRTKHAIIQEM